MRSDHLFTANETTLPNPPRSNPQFNRRINYQLGSKGFSELDKGIPGMFISEKVRKCVGYIGLEDNFGNTELKGTCFFVSQEFSHLTVTRQKKWCATARHIIDAIRQAHQGMADDDCKMFLRLNMKSGGTRDFEIPVSSWKSHPNPSFDAAVAPFELDLSICDHKPYPVDGFASQRVIEDQSIGIGSDLFFVGLFDQHANTSRNVPILRVGNIAAMPNEEPVKTALGKAHLYLIEARSRGGFSGSPVFAYKKPVLAMMGAKTINTASEFSHTLIGVIHGHFNESDGKEMFNAGIAMVTPIEVVRQILDCQEFRDLTTAWKKTIEAKNPSGEVMD